MGKPKKTLVGYRYRFGMQAVLGLKPIDRVLRILCDNRILATGPWTGGVVPIDLPTYFQDGKVSDGMVGGLTFYLNGTHDFDPYMQNFMGVSQDLVPRYDEIAYVVFHNNSSSGPFYFGNSPRPRDMLMIAERTETTCPFAEFALLPYEHPDFGTVNNFNPLAIYWELLIKGYESEYGDTFAAAAETLFNEGFGIWYYGGGADREAVQKELETYVDGRSYIDRETGIREFMLIRNDFVVEDLPVITEADLIGDPDIVFPRKEMAKNTFDISFSDRLKDFETATITVQDTAHADTYGVRRGDPITYKWCTDRELATKLGFRDVRAQTAGGVSGTLPVAGLHPKLHEGSPFLLDLPEQQISSVVCRVISIEETGPNDNSVIVSFTEDIFGVEVAPMVIEDLPGPLQLVAEPVIYQTMIEAPYWLGLVIGGDNFANSLEDDPTMGVSLILAGKPTPMHLGYQIRTDSGLGFYQMDTGDFTGAGELSYDDITRDQEEFVIPTLNGLEINDVIMIGNEFMRIDTIDPHPNGMLVTVGRGCIDTVPVAHFGAERVFIASKGDTDAEVYTDGQLIETKLITFVHGDTLNFELAESMYLTFGSRAYRPYPPGDYKMNGSRVENTFVVTDPVFTWAHRDRLLQVNENFIEDETYPDIGPEPGVTYRVRVYCYNALGVLLSTPVDTNVGTDTTYTLDLDLVDPLAFRVTVAVASVRDGLQSYTEQNMSFFTGLFIEQTTSTSYVTTTNGDIVGIV